jgi:hypothetical protein
MKAIRQLTRTTVGVHEPSMLPDLGPMNLEQY